MRSGGGSFGHVGMHVGEDWWTFLSTYDDHSPILDVAAGSTTVTLSIADRKAGDGGGGVRAGAGQPGGQVRRRGRAAARPGTRRRQRGRTACESRRDGEAA